jgi:membrane fusion protein (multidrug efflux system)
MASVADKDSSERNQRERGTPEGHEAVVREGSGLKTAIKWVVALAIIGGLGYAGLRIWRELSRVETTDDAQIDGTIAPVSARIAGHVLRVEAEDEKPVQAGEVLVELDRKDFEVAVDKARAELADAEATLASAREDVPIASQSTSSTLDGARSSRQDTEAQLSGVEQALGAARARLNSAEAGVKVAQAQATKSAQDLERSKVLVAKDEISRQDFDQASAAAAAAQATVEERQAMVAEARQNVSAAEKAIEQARARVAQADAAVESAMTGPRQVKVSEARMQAAMAKVAEKRAELEQAQLNLSYTVIAAPRAGMVGRKAVEAGQNIVAGQQLMSVVALDDIWVTANFKETQLKDMKLGQRVTFDVDANGRSYDGHLERISGASGARFSLLPPENATGNFVKVVQRIPVRIAIDPGQNQDQALRPGMSVTPRVHIH